MHDTLSVPVTPAPAATYRPSGRVKWASFLPLAAVTLVLSGVLAYLLAWTETFVVLKVLGAVLLGVPLLASLFLAIHVGQCRSPKLAGSLAVLAVTLYYVGHWQIAYYLHVQSYGPRAIIAVERLTGLQGLPGYVVLRTQMRSGPGSATFTGSVVNVGLFGLEFGVLLAGGSYLARRTARRAFYDRSGRWASTLAFLFQPQDWPAVRTAIDTQDWSKLDAVAKGATDFYRRRHAMTFRTEYLPGEPDAPAYVTVNSPLLLPHLRVLVALLPILGQLTRRRVGQRQVVLRDLAAHVGGFDLGPDSTPPAPADGVIGYWGSDAATRPAGEGPLSSLIRETGFSGSTLVGGASDFRDAADRESRRLLVVPPTGIESADAVGASLCYRAQDNAVRVLKRLSWFDLSLTLVFMLGSLLWVPFMILADVLNMHVGRWAGQAATVSGMTLAALGFASLLIHTLAMKRILRALLRRRFARRAGSLIGPATAQPLELVRLEDAKTFHVSKLTPEDWGLLEYDRPARRLVIEGVSHRYLIRGCDVLWVRRTGTTNSLSITIAWRIGDVTLEMTINRYAASLLAGLANQPLIGPLFRPIIGRQTRRFAERVCGVLGVECSAATT